MFSIIITTYNSSKHIQETLDNILNASENIEKEIIIVDDGSIDSTKEILKTYSDIKVIFQENQGVSAARNTALHFISNNSKLLTFIDDSDKVSTDFFVNHLLFFKKYPDINISFSPIMNIKNNISKSNPLNTCFSSNKEVIDILEDYTYIHFHIGGVVFRSDVLKAIKMPFDQEIYFWEDAKMINSLILKYKRYGLVKNCNYFYNLDDTNSLTKSSWARPERYTGHIKHNFLYMITLSIQHYGIVIKYVQYLILVHYSQFLLSYNFKNIDIKNINNPDFMEVSKKLFTYIDTDVIKNLKLEKRYKLFFYSLKGLNTYEHLKDTKVWIHSITFFNKRATISFSDEVDCISKNFKVYIKRPEGKHLVTISKKIEKDILHYLSSDFSRNIFTVELYFWELFKNNIFIIEDIEKDISIEVMSESISTRIINRIIHPRKEEN